MDMKVEEFSKRDLQILSLLGKSATNAKISQELGVGKAKVTPILKDLYQRLKCEHRRNPRNVAASYAVILNL